MSHMSSGKPSELIDPVEDNPSRSLSPRGGPRRTVESTLHGVRNQLRALQLNHSAAARHEAVHDTLRKVHEFGIPAGGDRTERQVVEELERLGSSAEEGLVSVLPQLLAILIRRESPLAAVEDFIVAKCGQSLHFAVECSLALMAERSATDKTLEARSGEFLDRIKRAWRNQGAGTSTPLRRTLSVPLGRGKRAAQSPFTVAVGTPRKSPSGDDVGHRSGSKTPESAASSEVAVHVQNDALEQELALLEKLTAISAQLKAVAKGRRNMALAAALGDLDAGLQKHSGGWPWHFTPMRHPDKPGGERGLCVVRVDAKGAHAFSTKERVPYLVFLEVASEGGEALPLEGRPRAKTHGAPPPYLGGSTLASRQQKAGVASSPAREGSTGNSSADEDAGDGEHQAISVLTATDVIRAEPPDEVGPAEAEAATPSAPAGSGHHVFGEPFADRQMRMGRTSPFAIMPGWHVQPLIVKANDELRQERFAMQLITAFEAIFARARLPLALRPYRILPTGPNSGVIEAVPDAVSLDALKQRTPDCPSLAAFFRKHFGGPRKAAYHRARLNFARSAAAYAIVCYLLQIKDRHNGNILLCADGSQVQIDFGFLLSNSPGGNMNFESAPFKLTNEYVELMGGTQSPLFRYFRYLLVRGFVEVRIATQRPGWRARALVTGTRPCVPPSTNQARKHHKKIVSLVQITLDNGGERWPCFRAGQAAVEALRMRFEPNVSLQTYTKNIVKLVSRAQGSYRTTCYDRMQYCCQGIFY